MYGILAFAGFAVVLAIINRMLRSRDRTGDFDPQAPSSAARPGLRRFFDFSSEGWRGDGVNQRPPAREQYR